MFACLLITLQTTNHIEKLSSALIRPGRVDVRYVWCFVRATVCMPLSLLAMVPHSSMRAHAPGFTGPLQFSMQGSPIQASMRACVCARMVLCAGVI